MDENLDTEMQQLATMHAEKAFGEYAELESEDDCSSFIAMEVDFKAGFRTCHALMIEEQEQLKKQLAVAVAALTTVSWYEKMKGLEGPALIAKDALSQIEEMGK